MTDIEVLREIEKEEKRFVAANCSRGKMLAKSARDYFKQLKEAEKKYAAVQAKHKTAQASLKKLEVAVKAAEEIIRRKVAEVKKLRSEMVTFRKTVKNGDSLKCKENVARLRMVEKVKVLKTMQAE